MTRLGSGGFPCFRSSWPLLACSILFGEALFASFRFPVIISYASSVLDQPAAELAEHAAGGDDGDLPGTVGVGENFLLYKVVFLLLAGDDLV